MRHPLRALSLTLLLFAVAACSGPSLTVHDGTEPVLQGNEATDFATLQRLANEARALARTTGCASAAQCDALPMGAKPCGGPWTYLPYCPLTTDRAALEAKLAQVERFERSFNERYGRGSTCDFVGKPQLRLEDGQCRFGDSRGAPY